MSGEDGRYVPTGHLVFAVDTTLFAVPFDAASGRVTGGRVPVVEGVRREVWVQGNTAAAHYGFSDDGMLVYVHGRAERLPIIPRDLVMVDLQGNARSITDVRRDYWRPRISPDGTRVVVEVFDGKNFDLWVVSLENGVSTQVTFASVNDFAVWTPDGKSIVFNGTTEGTQGIYRKPVDGSGAAEFLGVKGETVPTDISREGTLAFSLGDQTAERAIWTLSLSDRKAVEILATPAQEHHAMFSPTATGLRTRRMRQGDRRSTCGRTRSDRARSEGCRKAVAPDRCGRRTARRSTIEAPPRSWSHRPRSDRASCPAAHALSSRLSDSGSPGNASAFDIHPDGSRFVMVTMGDLPPPLPAQINVVFNWFEDLKRRAPVGR